MTTSFTAADRIVRKTPHALVREYLGYWTCLVPRTHEEYYHRWLFSYMSIRQRWQDNVRGFLLLKELPHGFSESAARETLRAGRMGFFNTRAPRLAAFSRDFWACPEAWYPRHGETLRDCRARLSGRVDGLGRAKVSFVLEMLCPASSEVVCLDSHMLKLYGHKANSSVKDAEYARMEDHWLGLCKHLRKPSPMVRHIYWDRLRDRVNCRYWSHVLERPEETGRPADERGVA